MSNLNFCAALFVVFFAVGQTKADDAKDARATYEVAYAAWKAHDVESASAHYDDGATLFQPSGDLLHTVNFDVAKSVVESGRWKPNPGPLQHCEVKVYNGPAVATGYQRMTATLAESTTSTQTRRFTAILVKNECHWKIVHQHLSLLTPTNPE